jgi:hypothetical protein
VTAHDNPTFPNEACTHPKVTHRHGTYACYVLDKCRCRPCSRATVAQRAEQDRRRNYARHNSDYAPYVPATAARAHMQVLRAAGLGSRQIAKRAGVARSVVTAILGETPARSGERRKKVTRETEAKLLAVPLPRRAELPDGANVDGKLTLRRIQSLTTLGWTIPTICARAGTTRQTYDELSSGRRSQLSVKHAKAFARVYLELRNHVPVANSSQERTAITRTLQRARKAGYPDPYDLEAVAR